MRRLVLFAASVLGFLRSFAPLQAQVLHFAELNTVQIQALDRAHTVILLTDGIMEEHGPFLPSYTDGYWHEALTQDLARSLVARPGYTVVLFPVIPLGTSAANVLGRHSSFPGSFTVTESTLRSVYMDLADSFGELGFRNIFIVDAHGGPTNHLALDRASDYFHDTWHGTMVHLFGTMRLATCCHPMEETLPKAQVAENGLEVHAGTLEHAQMLFLHPGLVSPLYRDAPSNGAADVAGLVRVASRPDWPGYLGAPRYATASLGALYFQQVSAAARQLANEILDGKTDPYTLPRYSTVMMQATRPIEDDLRKREAEAASRHERWLAAHPEP